MAAVNRPPAAHPGPDARNPHVHINNGAPNSGLQDLGLHGTSHDPGPSTQPQHHMSARPVFYVHAPPPPPPFLHYQWPMPFSYNPFTGYSSMGYGVVMPPFPPPPYMEAPTYILPHPHIQPVDYRRMLHPQAHPNSVPYQNLNQTRRNRPPHSVPVRETVNCEVQTEPTQRGGGAFDEGIPLISSDSGRGTASNSPSSSTSSSHKQAHVENYDLAISNVKASSKLNRTGTSSTVRLGFNMPHTTGRKSAQSCIRGTSETQKRCIENAGQDNHPTCRDAHCNMWSVSSPDTIVPVCSSSQREDEVTKERRVSVPDILMSWGGGTQVIKVAEKVMSTAKHLPSYDTDMEPEKSYQRPTEMKNDRVVAGNVDPDDDAEDIFSSDGETLFKILKLPFALHELLSESRAENDSDGLVSSRMHYVPYHDETFPSLNITHKLLDKEKENGNETIPHDDTTETIPHQTSSCQIKRKMNESVWSVESLMAYIPSKEWMMHNATSGPEVIVELTEEAENDALSCQNGNVIVKSTEDRRKSRRFSSSDSVPMSDSWLIFSTPTDKLSATTRCEVKSDIDTSEMRGPSQQGQNTAPTENIRLDSLVGHHSKITLPTPNEDVDRNGSSEPEANQSPNQESLILPEQLEKSLSLPEKEEMSTGQPTSHNGVDMESEDGVCGNEVIPQLRNEQLCVPTSDQNMTVSQSNLVDCGIQCMTCSCEDLKGHVEAKRRQHFKYSDGRKSHSSRPDGLCVNGYMQKNHKRHGQWRTKGQALSYSSTEKSSTQHEAFYGYCGKAGKKGGNGKNPRY